MRSSIACTIPVASTTIAILAQCGNLASAEHVRDVRALTRLRACRAPGAIGYVTAASAGPVWRSSLAQTKPSAIITAAAVSKVGTLPAC